jgi:ATP-dependent Clp protease ATP-binding subunit ClpA
MRGRSLIWLLLLYPTLVFATIPQSSDDLSMHSLAKVIGDIAQSGQESAETLALLGELNGSDAAAVTTAAKVLATRADENIIFALLARAEDEIKSKTPNIEMISSLVEITASVASYDYIHVFQSLNLLAAENQKSLRRGSRILKRLIGNAKNEVQSRVEITPLPIIKKKPDVVAGPADSGLPPRVSSFTEYLQKAATEKGDQRFGKKGMPQTPEEFLLKCISRELTDELRKQKAEGSSISFNGRDDEKLRAFQVLARTQGRMPVFVGGSGVGKSTIVLMMAQDVIDDKIPDTELYKPYVDNAEFIVTSAAKISQMALSNEPPAQSAAVESFFEAVRQTEKNYTQKFGRKKPLIVVIDNLQTLAPPQLATLKQELENTVSPITVIGTAFSNELDLALKPVAGLEKSLEKIGVPEFSVEQTRKIMHDTMAAEFLKKFRVTFDDDTLDALFRVSVFLKPNLALPEGPLRVLEDLAIAAHSARPADTIALTESDVYNFAQKVTRLPVDPRDAAGLTAFLEDTKKKMYARVIGQDRLISAGLEALEQVLANNPKRPASLLFMGPTGVGKTLVGESLAEIAFHDKARFFRIDGTALQDGGYALSAVFGLPPGVDNDGEATSGSFMDWLDDPSRGKYGGVILVDECDKMPLDVWKRLMEFQSSGVIYGGDGKPRYANRHIIIFTSNKGAKIIFPDSVLGWTRAEIETRAASVTEDMLKSILQKADPNSTDEDIAVLSAELVGRIQRAVLALPVTRETAPDVASVEISIYAKSFRSDYGITVTASDDVKKYFAETGVNYLSGARPIRDQINRYLTPALTAARNKWTLDKTSTVTIGLKPQAPGEAAKFIVSYNGESFLADAPVMKNENPLADPAVIEILDHLSERMHAHMPEQPEAVDAIIEGIRGKYADARRKKPLAVTVVGRVGLGKTELGRAAAFALYGSTDRFEAIPLSDIANETAWRKLFLPVFERILMSNPQGAVIGCDEFSNMGGGDLVIKDMLIKKFLNILEEGVWVSPDDPTRVYDLRKFLFLFTGNDLETLTQGVTSDEENTEIWRLYHARAKVEEQLKKNGVPESFLSRQDAVVMIKPLVGEGKGNVSARLLDDFRKRIEAQHQGIKVLWSDAFAATMGEAFFTHARGARSMRSVIDNKVSAMITTILTQFGYDEKKLVGVELKFSIEDNLPKSSFLPKNANGKEQDFAREVLITVELSKGGEVQETLTVNATADAQDVLVLTESEATMAAYHEVGRAVLNAPEITGQKLSYLSVRGTLVGSESWIGYSRFEPVVANRTTTVTRKVLVARLKSLWGGRLAIEKMGYDPDFGWDRNLSEMRELISTYLKKFEPYSDRQSSETKLFNEAKQLATDDIEKHWPLVEALVKKALTKGHLTNAEFEQNCAEILSSSP